MQQLFKSAMIFKLAGPLPAADVVEQALAAAAFVPCTATQDHAIGFVPPREDNGAFLEAVGGEWILRAMIETKTVPGPLVRKKAKEAADQIEATTGRKPGRKEMKALREDAFMALLPAAFPKQLAVTIWIDRASSLLVLDTASQARADYVVTLLVRAIDGLALTIPQTKVTPASAMTQWLTAEPADWPGDFAVERECELCSTDEEKAAVRFTRHNLVTEEVRRHIAEGKLPTRLALSWDGRLAFVLTDAGNLKKLQFLDGAFDGRDDDEDGFDADVAIATGELGQMIPALFNAMGGLIQQEGGAA